MGNANLNASLDALRTQIQQISQAVGELSEKYIVMCDMMHRWTQVVGWHHAHLGLTEEGQELTGEGQ